MLMPRLLRFTFCFLLFAAQLPLCLLGLPPDFSRPPLPETDQTAQTRQTRQLRPDISAETADSDPRLDSYPVPRPASDRFCRPSEPLLFLLLSLFVAPLSLHQNAVSVSRCIKMQFPEPKAPPSPLNTVGLGAF